MCLSGMMNKDTWKNIGIKTKLAIITALAAFTLGWILTITCFFEEPKGEVTDSTLWILGQSLIYASGVFGVTSYFNAESKRISGEIDDFERRMRRKEDEDGETEGS